MNLTNKLKKKSSNFFRKAKQKALPYIIAPIIAFTPPIFYGCNGGGGGNSGGSSEENYNNPLQEVVEIKTGVTNYDGQVYFTDNQTLEEVILEVVDKDDKLPLPGMEITYYDGDGYEVFLVDDSSNEYLPSIGIYPHNSKHVIETGKSDGGIYSIYTIDEDNFLGNVVWSWKSENQGGFSTYNYERTVDYDEYIEISDRQAVVIDLLWKGIELFFGELLPKKPSEIIKHLFPEVEYPPQRWDIYMHRDGYDENSRISIIPSNIPTVNIDTLNINYDEVDISWKGTDKDTYEEALFLPSNKDLTKYLDGNDTSDLIYSHRVINDGWVYDGNDWTEYNSNTSATINLPDCGAYTLELRVKDEVDNIGETAVDFNIDKGCAPTKSLPDLAIKEIHGYYNVLPCPGNTTFALYYSVEVLVKNIGDKDAPEFKAETAVLFQDNTVKYYSNCSDCDKTLEAGEERKISLKPLKSDCGVTVGPYPNKVLWVKVDSEEEIEEFREDNNEGGYGISFEDFD